jgi:hypothetical protein
MTSNRSRTAAEHLLGRNRAIQFGKRLLCVLIVVFATGLAVNSNGQEALQHWIYSGSFNLPFDAKWNNVTLPAGRYSLAVDQANYNGRVLLRRGTRAIGVLLPEQFSSDKAEHIEKAELVCIRHSGGLLIRALNLPNRGTFYYFTPKDLQAHLIATPQLVQEIPVFTAGK